MHFSDGSSAFPQANYKKIIYNQNNMLASTIYKSDCLDFLLLKVANPPIGTDFMQKLQPTKHYLVGVEVAVMNQRAAPVSLRMMYGMKRERLC
jgi:hypothetical protein